MSKFEVANRFSLSYYESILKLSLDTGYRFLRLRDFVEQKPDVHKEKICVLRHDLDDKPQRLRGMIDSEESLGVRSTVFVLVHTDKYNPFSYPALNVLRKAEDRGFEIGLHTNFVEVSQIVDAAPDKILANEVNALRGYFSISGIACHRNIDFMYNSLPYVEANWERLKTDNRLLYQAYQPSIFNELVFVNEGFLPHLGWRSHLPEDVIASGKSFCLSTHPHWWHQDHAFED
jgi:hypothetical protein